MNEPNLIIKLGHVAGKKPSGSKYSEGSPEEEMSESPDEEKSESGDSDLKEAVAQGFLDAVKSGDPKELLEAFQDLLDSCS